MASQALVNSDRSRTHWTQTMERYFIDLMLDQVHRGNRMGHTFNKQAWADMHAMFNGKFGSQYEKDVLKSRYTVLWKQFNDMKNLLDQSGFSWDDTRKMVVADDCVWDAYIKKQAYCEVAECVKNMIIGCIHDDGCYLTYGMGSVAPASNEHSRRDWTPAMDQYFTELMLDQLGKGNKITNTFNEQAWTVMLSLFNSKFCTQHGKRQQMIAADDDVWDNYIKAHPHAQAYRKKILLNFQDLSLLYGKTVNNGIRSHLHPDKDLEYDIVQIKAGEGEYQTPISGDGYWTLPMDHYFIDLLLDQVLRGNKIGQGFITQAWIEMVTLFNMKFGSHYDKDVLKNRYRHLRRQYNDITALLEHSGFSWDDTREMVTAEGFVWDSYIQAIPDAQSYRNKTVPNYHKLCVIYGQESSNGGDNSLACNGDLDGVDPVWMIEGTDIQCNANSDHSRTDWIPPMDRYLIDLMLEQVRKGNRKVHTFNKQAWADMVALFNERFRTQHEKSVLKSRHKSLRKQYHHIKNLLDHRGFSWDEMRQMVTAYDAVWAAYLKEHPDAKSYRAKPKPNYNDLCLIYGSPIADGQCNQSYHGIDFNGDGRELNNSSHSRTDWTPLMDRYFIDLMLEHVQKGSMVDHKFNKQAWSDMAARFNAEFGSYHDKDVLKSRFKHWRKLFNGMRTLLEQNGFAWDERRQMVTAANELWDSYIKENPDARSYRTRSLPNYNDLFLIYENAINKDTQNQSSFCIDDNDYDLGVGIGEEDDQFLASSDSLDVDWMIPMDIDPHALELDMDEIEKEGVATALINDKEVKNCISIETIVDALQSIPGMDDELFLDACHLLEDEKKAEMFVALDAARRQKWLLRKLRT
ncbi:L10-interacting MYB domain-containing protein [Vitis vinifera]|uniref:L10-interacting MYB domain-containing protein n=1 Tax=Vitis vinifera TaxID=29760 RepID=A0A438KC65_VITVI|nr:L10-interacting MYB domain-containing protein [Vitis vinifera]